MVCLRKSFEWAIAIAACVLLLLPSLAHTGETVKRLRLAYSGFGVGTAVSLVARDAGLFKRYGLEIENVYIDDALTGGIQALIGIDVFLGSGNPVVPMQAILKGADIVFLGSHASMEHYKFGVSPKISSIKQLKGKKIGVSGLGRKSDLIARVVLRRGGLDPVSDVEIVEIGFSPERALALSKNLIHGAPLVPEIAIQAEKLGLKVLDIKEVPVISELLITTRSLIKRDNEVMRRFMKGYLTAIHYYLTHKDESMGIIDRHVTIVGRTSIEAMYHALAAQLEPTPFPNEEAVQALIDAASVTDSRAKSLKPADLFDLRILKKLKASGFVENLYAEKINL
jgi:ABC-type nitrate/sulfonate/bicarbonate transport system substrate-binding protein